MLKELLEFLQQQKRETKTDVKIYGKYGDVRKREAIYEDSAGKYKVMNCGCQEDIEVHSSRSFIEYIKEELRRRENETGRNATLTIGINGGKFVADDSFDEGVCEYSRINSQQWNLLKSLNGKFLNHEEFLLDLSRLSPSVQDFKNVYKNYLKIRKMGESELVSNPVFVDGEAESGYMVKYKLRGGNEADGIVPDGFTVNVPFIKASKKLYEVRVDCQILNDSSNSIRIKVNIPTIEKIEEDAVIDEITEIKEALKEQTDLLVLSDI